MNRSSLPVLTNSSRGFRWRVVDIVMAAVLGVAFGICLLGVNAAYAPLRALVNFTPGASGILAGLFLFGAVLGALVIRKPGAAIFVETLGALTESALGVNWGWSSLLYGLIQGIGAEMVFLTFVYRFWNGFVGLLAGIGAGVGAIVAGVLVGGLLQRSAAYLSINLPLVLISGAVIGVLAWLLVRALAKTGVLNAFASGQPSRRRRPPGSCS